MFVAGIGVVTGVRGAIEAAVSTLVSWFREDAVVVKEACEALLWRVPFAWMVAGGGTDVEALWAEMLVGAYWLP